MFFWVYVEINEDKNKARRTEPAFVKQETVHIADTISERDDIGHPPEIAAKIVCITSFGKDKT